MSETLKNIIIVLLIIAILAMIAIISFIGGNPDAKRVQTELETTYQTNAPSPVNGSSN